MSVCTGTAVPVNTGTPPRIFGSENKTEGSIETDATETARGFKQSEVWFCQSSPANPFSTLNESRRSEGQRAHCGGRGSISGASSERGAYRHRGGPHLRNRPQGLQTRLPRQNDRSTRTLRPR